jgi:hypothetical protein
MLTEEKMQEINKIANLDFSVLPSPNSSFSQQPPASAVQQELIEAALRTFGYPPLVIAQVDFFRKPENLETLQRFAIDKTAITQNADAMKEPYTAIKNNVFSTSEEKEAATKAINNIDNMARIVQDAEQYVARMHQTFRQETYSEFDERLSTLQQKIGPLQPEYVDQLKEVLERYGRLKSQFYDQSPVKVTEDKNNNELVVHAPPGVDSYNFMVHLQAQAFLEDLKAHRAELMAAQSTVGV